MMNTINDARWQQWGDSFLNSGVERMDKDTASILYTLLLEETLGGEELRIDLEADVNNTFPWKVGQAHAQRIGLNIDYHPMVFITSIAKNPGELVMYIHALRRFQQKSGCEKITFRHLCESVFPNGFLTKETLHRLWDEQKLKREDYEANPNLRGDNYLDTVVNA